ncbi:hypothetical protein N8H22_12015 [Stutzerimonas stutzeri]|uniref:hypothetical protein n=1 Tax=Stutzerimonas sp. S1 TaxID=3030652 RepID=UPI0022256A39|nr:hypothetical protein [Stutzerimonas sp. S1]MCW3149320.1 hypothetical protein [Stutzerimonas sp. S1]
MDRHRQEPASSATPLDSPARHTRSSTLVSLAYVLALILVFALSLYLLPEHTGLGKLLWGA